MPKFLLLSAGAASCSNGWVKYSTSCYYFSSSQLIYSTAQTTCQALDSRANLACVGSADENSFIKTKAEENELEYGVWIGYSDSSVESDWIWEDSTCTSTYSNWASNEPNGGDSDDCAKLDIRTGRSEKWYDRPCSSDYTFVCEYADEDEENADDNDDGSGGSAGRTSTGAVGGPLVVRLEHVRHDIVRVVDLVHHQRSGEQLRLAVAPQLEQVPHVDGVDIEPNRQYGIQIQIQV